MSYLSDEPIDYDFSLLSTAFALVYVYGLAWPALLWVALRYYGLGEWSVIEAIAVWGYGQFIWIPISVRSRPSNLWLHPLTAPDLAIQLICIAPSSILRWVLTGVGFVISGYFLCANVYPILQTVRLRSAIRLGQYFIDNFARRTRA